MSTRTQFLLQETQRQWQLIGGYKFMIERYNSISFDVSTKKATSQCNWKGTLGDGGHVSEIIFLIYGVLIISHLS